MNSLPAGGDELVRRFEAEWEEGRKPNLSDFLPPPDSAGALALALRLIEIDLRQRIGDGEAPPTVERYFHIPGFALTDEQRVALQTQEDRLRETLPADFIQQVPGHELLGETNRHPRQVAAFNVDALQVLGSGGMGVVYRLKEADLDRDVAVKIILPKLYPQGCSRFENEARILARLEHPGVVPIHVIGRYPDGRPFFTMKIVEGQTLQKLLAGRSSPTEDVTRHLDIFEQVCQTVAFAHSKNVLHRDLKPGNVMVGAFGEVQVMDWGLGKLLDFETPSGESAVEPGQADGHVTLPGHAMGTSAYAAPEQARGNIEQISTRSDVFGLGAILCEILTGSPPYTSSNRLEQAKAADLAEAWARLSACGGDPELKEIVRKCLAPEQEARFAHAGEVARRLADYRAASQKRLEAARLETEKATARFAAEHQALDAEKRRLRNARWALGLGLALTVGAILSAWIIYKQSKEKEEESREKEQAVRQTARLAFGQGQALCEKGDIPRGLFWFVRSLELDPKDEELQDAGRRQISVWRMQIPTLSKIWKEPNAVVAAQFHPSGKTFFLRFKDGSIAAYGLKSNKKLWSHESDPGQPWLIAPRGTPLVTVRKDGTLQIIDTAAGTLLHEAPMKDRVLAAAFRKDKPIPLIAVAKNGQAWVSEDGKTKNWPTEDALTAADFDAAGQHLLIRSDKRLVCWHLPSKKATVQVPDPAMFASARMRMVGGACGIAASIAALITPFEKTDPNEIEPTMRLFATLSAPVKDAAISPNGKLIVAAQADHRIQMWHTDTGDPIFGVDNEEREHPNVSKVVFNAASSHLISASHESLVIWKSTGDKVVTLELPRKTTAPFGFLRSGPDSATIFAQGDGTGFRLARVSGNSAAWYSVPFAGQPLAVHPDGTLVLVADEKGTCFLWQIGEMPPKWIPGLANVHTATYAEDGASAVVVFRKIKGGKTVFSEQIWDLNAGAARNDEKPLGDARMEIEHTKVEATTADGRWRVTGTGDHNRSALVLHNRSLECRIGPIIRCGAVSSVRFHPDQRKRELLIVGADGRLATLDVPTPNAESPAEIRRHLEYVTGVQMDESGNLVDLSPNEWEARKSVEHK